MCARDRESSNIRFMAYKENENICIEWEREREREREITQENNKERRKTICW